MAEAFISTVWRRGSFICLDLGRHLDEASSCNSYEVWRTLLTAPLGGGARASRAEWFESRLDLSTGSRIFPGRFCWTFITGYHNCNVKELTNLIPNPNNDLNPNPNLFLHLSNVSHTREWPGERAEGNIWI